MRYAREASSDLRRGGAQSARPPTSPSRGLGPFKSLSNRVAILKSIITNCSSELIHAHNSMTLPVGRTRGTQEFNFDTYSSSQDLTSTH